MQQAIIFSGLFSVVQRYVCTLRNHMSNAIFQSDNGNEYEMQVSVTT